MRTYTSEFKVTVAKEAIETGCTVRSLVEKYDIGGESTVRDWIKLYKEHGESYFFRNQNEKKDTSGIKNITPENQVLENIKPKCDKNVIPQKQALETIIPDCDKNTAPKQTLKTAISGYQKNATSKKQPPKNTTNGDKTKVFNKKDKPLGNRIKTKSHTLAVTLKKRVKISQKFICEQIKKLNFFKSLKKNKKEK